MDNQIEDDVCYYCGALGSATDHVIPKNIIGHRDI